eukprot:gnl/TRDRNA2_/TRDRNA2_167978_c3_seq3.p1 gnl/TRDRNA2_/TRDRNA2_167978_c3~~gnl/TRDRNA2_/TRDRNA2_167978_c3_seq3.p1  ORF type:complete len:902 (+),score=144.27 gnl/TRDRNA2_/TRDRNA2_167978_c3_seq3:85-2790(+)
MQLKIRVRTTAGHITEVVAQDDDSVESFQEALEKCQGTPAKLQMLLLHSKGQDSVTVLRPEGLCLRDYGLHSNDDVLLIRQLPPRPPGNAPDLRPVCDQDKKKCRRCKARDPRPLPPVPLLSPPDLAACVTRLEPAPLPKQRLQERLFPETTSGRRSAVPLVLAPQPETDERVVQDLAAETKVMDVGEASDMQLLQLQESRQVPGHERPEDHTVMVLPLPPRVPERLNAAALGHTQAVASESLDAKLASLVVAPPGGQRGATSSGSGTPATPAPPTPAAPFFWPPAAGLVIPSRQGSSEVSIASRMSPPSSARLLPDLPVCAAESLTASMATTVSVAAAAETSDQQRWVPSMPTQSLVHQGSHIAASTSESSRSGRIRRSDLQTIGRLGVGAFGMVSLEENIRTGKTYALKAVSKGYLAQLRMEHSVLNEKKILKMSSSHFVIRLLATYNGREHVYFLLEAALGGELFHTYELLRFYGSETHARFYCGCVVEALVHLHERSVVYRDLKPENLLLDARGYCKLTDMGLAKIVTSVTYTLVGTPDYMAPEVIACTGHTASVDWWTLGVLLYELLVGRPPFEANNTEMVYERVKQGINSVQFPPECEGTAGDLVRILCHANPESRSRPPELYQDPWFSSFDWEALRELRMPAPYEPVVRGPRDLENFRSCEGLENPPLMPYRPEEGRTDWDIGFEDDMSDMPASPASVDEHAAASTSANNGFQVAQAKVAVLAPKAPSQALAQAPAQAPGEVPAPPPAQPPPAQAPPAQAPAPAPAHAQSSAQSSGAQASAQFSGAQASGQDQAFRMDHDAMQTLEARNRGLEEENRRLRQLLTSHQQVAAVAEEVVTPQVHTESSGGADKPLGAKVPFQAQEPVLAHIQSASRPQEKDAEPYDDWLALLEDDM